MVDTLKSSKVTPRNLSYGNNEGSILPRVPCANLWQGCFSKEKMGDNPLRGIG